MTAVFLATLAILNYFIGKRRVLYPPLVFSFVWFLDAIIFSLSPIFVSEVHPITWQVISVGALAFSAGGILIRLFPKSFCSAKVRVLSHPTNSRLSLIILLIICLICLPIMFRDVLQQGGGGSASEILARSRLSHVDMGDQGRSWGLVFGTLPAFSIAVAMLCLIEDGCNLFWISVVVSAACCILTGGRSYLLQLFVSLAAIHLLLKGKDRLISAIKFVATPFAIFICLFSALIFFDKDVSGFEGDTSAILTNFLLAYIVVPIPALDYVLTHSPEYTNAPHHSFEFILLLLNKFGVPVNVPNMADAYVYVPLPANVYTIYKFYVTDYGLYLAFVVVFIIGFIQTGIYYRAIAGHKVALFIAALLVYPVVMSIFDDLFFAGGFMLILKSWLIAAVYFGLLNRMYCGFRIPHLTLVRFVSWQKRGKNNGSSDNCTVLSEA
jgi:oligosaccharide repeat unit polymerase